MSTSGDVHVGDLGTEIRLMLYDAGVVVNVSSATSKQVVLTKPDGSTVTKSAAFLTDGSDGGLKYVTVTGDIDQAGWWKATPIVEFASGSQHWTGEALPFLVLP